MKMAMHIVLALTLSSSVQASFLGVRSGKVQTEADPAISNPKVSAPQAVPQAAVAVATHQEPDKAAAARASAAEAQQHLQAAMQAANMTEANVNEIHATGKKIVDTAGKIKDIYGGSDSDADAAKAKDGKDKKKDSKDKDSKAKDAPEVEAGVVLTTFSPEEKARLNESEREEAAWHRLYDVIAQIVFAILYWFLVVKHYPTYRELGPPNQAAKDLQAVNEVKATCHTSASNLFLSWCCTGPRAAHTFYTALGFNYWAGCCLTSLFPCCTLWYFNSFTDLNERLGGDERSVLEGLFCACCCSCCVIAQDAEALDRIAGLETRFCTVRRSK